MSLLKLYEVYASRIGDNSTVRYFFKDHDLAMIKYNRLKNELDDVVKNVHILEVDDRGQKTED